MQQIKLTEYERQDLIDVHKNNYERKICDRIKSILMLNAGYTIKEVSEILMVDEDTIGNWKTKFNNRKNLDEWYSDNYVEYQGKLTAAEKKEIEEYVENNIISDSKMIIQFVKEKFRKEFSTDGMVKLLHRLGFEYKQTTLIPGQYDSEKQRNFKETYEARLASMPENEELLFIDGVHPQHNTICGKAWIKRGEVKNIESNTGRERINISGAYNPENQDVIIQEDIKLNSESTINFFKKIEYKYSDMKRINIICDNAKYYKNEKVHEYLKKSKIKLIYLPPYSPNLNLIERLWKYMRKKVINNKYYKKLVDFRDSIFNFFDTLPDDQKELSQFIGKKLHLLET